MLRKLKFMRFIVFVSQRCHNWNGIPNTVNMSQGQKSSHFSSHLCSQSFYSSGCKKSHPPHVLKGKVNFNRNYLGHNLFSLSHLFWTGNNVKTLHETTQEIMVTLTCVLQSMAAEKVLPFVKPYLLYRS